MAEISTRDTILEAFKTDLKNITITNGFQNEIGDRVVRKYVPFDTITHFPVLMVLGGKEDFDDDMGDKTNSEMVAQIGGFTKDSANPESAQCSLISDVIKWANNSTYNTQQRRVQPMGLDTDEGMLHESIEGLALFFISLKVRYKFSRSTP